MSEQIRIEGIVRAQSYKRGSEGKQFLGAVLECADGKAWLIDYSEQSPFHAFADRQVSVSGEPYHPKGQALMGWRDRKGDKFGHFRVAAMRLVEGTPDAPLLEVEAGQELSGRFERQASGTPESTLSFVTEKGDNFLVFNDPAGLTVGRSVEITAYPVQPSPSIPRSIGKYLWIVCPCSMADLWEWRERHG
jgi:hypothetical protein